jgi:hypothetical protein
MSEYIDFWLAKVVVDLAMAGIVLGICGLIYLAIYLYCRFK